MAVPANIRGLQPDPDVFPDFDHNLRDAMQRETEMLFESVVLEDTSVLRLLDADYTFMNERLAKHYGVPNIIGNEFRRVTLPDATRRGLLGQASILMATSVADRTSPVLRGKWIMNVLLGSPPPPPPPNVPTFDETNGIKNARVLSVRERMEAHRANPACTSCHRVIDPLGLALENFDAIGSWRIKDGDTPVDATGTMYDGSKLDGPASLREALLRHSDVVILSFIENLMTYALGRPVEYYDMPAIRSIVAEASASGNRMSAFVVGIVKSTPFQMAKAAEATTSEAAAAGASVAAKASRK
jgi:hypothetical protein